MGKKIAKGRFGDGLQSGCSVFVAAHESGSTDKLEIETCGYRYQFSYRNQVHCWSTKTLHFTVEQMMDYCPPETNVEVIQYDPSTDTRVVITGCDELDLTRYLFLDTSPQVWKTPALAKYEILSAADHAGRIYIREMAAVNADRQTSFWNPRP